MTREEIISGLKFTVDMFLFDTLTGETITEPRNDMDKITIDACRAAIELLEQEPTMQDKQAESEKYQKAYDDGYTDGYAQARFDYDVLDKIRAEIEEQKECRCFDDDEMLVYRTGLDDALYIIDKYTESEESNDERRSNTYS